MKNNVEITNKELRVLGIFLSNNPCGNGCTFPEMQTSKKDCNECELIKIKYSLLEKFNLL